MGHHSVTSEEETATVAAELATRLKPGDVLCLRGDLGAGKTTFTRYLVKALGSRAPVSSPTFTLVHEYEGGQMPIAHIDCYRLGDDREFLDAGLGEYLNSDDWLTILEWPERIEDLLPENRITVWLRDTGPESREIEVEN
ncbi:MAG: tRNA (adenosine(37)-N6)-threonylcarbamoyltransferase complex ATPase subunit type 1 TsaE [Armatimonas sp.]